MEEASALVLLQEEDNVVGETAVVGTLEQLSRQQKGGKHSKTRAPSPSLDVSPGGLSSSTNFPAQFASASANRKAAIEAWQYPSFRPRISLPPSRKKQQRGKGGGGGRASIALPARPGKLSARASGNDTRKASMAMVPFGASPSPSQRASAASAPLPWSALHRQVRCAGRRRIRR